MPKIPYERKQYHKWISAKNLLNRKDTNLGKHWKIKDTSNMGKHMIGENNWNWKGGITPKYVLERNKLKLSIEYKLWRKSVFTRDKYVCQKCKIKSGMGKAIILHPHHIKNWSSCEELRTLLENGITFCQQCHREFHQIYGIKNNNLEQVKEFTNNYEFSTTN
jgi:hypothetical protein